MPRVVSDSLRSLKGYISTYRLAHLLSDVGYLEDISHLNKKLIGINFSILSYVRIGALLDSEHRFLETLSDLNSCLMMELIGAYKLVKVSQRLAIENFLRAYLKEVEGDTNVYIRVRDLKDAIKSSNTYITYPNIRGEMDLLMQSYSNLSLFVHSVHSTNLAKTSHLSNFPRHNKRESRLAITALSRDIESMIFIICIAHKSQFKDLHFSERDTILDTLPPYMARDVTE